MIDGLVFALSNQLRIVHLTAIFQCRKNTDKTYSKFSNLEIYFFQFWKSQ